MDPQVPPSTMPANFGVPENTPPAPPPPANLPSMENKKLKTYLVMLGVVLLLVAVILGSYFLFFRKKTGSPPPKNTGNVINLPKYFINCDDVRHVHEEENLIYVACLGGVLVVDKGSGEVRDQIGLPDGLSNSTVTSLIKKEDQLFLGTQDGVTVFNLKTREAKKISVEEGLVNGANVELFEDGDNIWVATFDGVSLLDTKTLGLTNYTTELDPQAEKRNIVNMLVTEKYVYFLEVASVHSRGAVIMLNKETSEFKVFGPDAFGVTGPYARIDFNTLGQFKDKVFVAEGNKLFMAQIGEDSWQKIESANIFISNDMKTEFAALNILPNTDTRGILLSSGNKIYRYIPESDATEVVYDFEGYAGILFRNSGDSVWFRNSGDGSWISKLFLTSLKVTQIYLKDRPVSVSRLLAAIDNKPIILSLDGVYEYNLETDKFKKWDGFGASNVGYGYSETGLLPIPDTDEVFSVWQSCGQGCEKPLAQIYNFLEIAQYALNLPSQNRHI